ncbi:MAG: radical SAM protein [Nitrospirae bacterium]|nr:radical SAM protein [Nitrospirota bacterium]
MPGCAEQQSEVPLELRIKDKVFFLHSSLMGEPYPEVLSLESTNFCNLSCSHCGHSQFPVFQKGHFDMTLFDTLDHLLGTRIKTVSLSNFGEPFMSQIWPQLLKKVCSIDELNISFITNGLMLDRHLLDVADHRISFAVSIDGASEKTYGHFRGKNNFSRLIQNLTLLKKQKDQAGVVYPRITFLFTVSKINCHELVDMVELAASLGVTSLIVQFQLFFDQHRFESESLYFAQDEYNQHIREAAQKAGELGIAFVHPDSFDGKTMVSRETISNCWLGRDSSGEIRCFSQRAICYVKYNGCVEACCSPDHNVMGDLKTDSFEDIWHGRGYRDLRLAFDRGEWPDRCRYCNIIQALDVHDKRAHFIALQDMGQPPSSVRQEYRISELDTRYKQALLLLRSNNISGASELIVPMSRIDRNLIEVGNARAFLYGMEGRVSAMCEQLKTLLSIAPKDKILLANYTAAVTMSKKKTFFDRLFRNS